MTAPVYMDAKMVSNLKKFKYSGEDKSLLYIHVLTPMNRKLINYVPRDLAPNLLTLIGFLFILSAHLLTLWYSPQFDQALPPWLSVWCAVCLFSYQTIDNLDGSQARRTGSSSPLGLLFDHGIDALNTTFANFVVMAVFQTGVTYTSLWLWAVAYVAFVAATWEEFFVGKLTLGIVNGPSDGIMLSVIMFLLAAWQPGLWATSIGETAWLRSLLGEGSSLLGWRLHWVPLGVVSLGLVPTVLDSTWTVYSRGFQKSVFAPLAKLFPFAQHLALVALWAVYSPARVFETHPRVMMLANCFLFCNMICKLMLAHLCDVDFKALRGSTLPLTLAVASSLLPAAVPGALPVVAEETALYLVFVAHLVLYAHFVYHVIDEITDALSIRCFVITEQQKAAQREKEAREAAAAAFAAAGVEAASEATTRRRRRPSSNA